MEVHLGRYSFNQVVGVKGPAMLLMMLVKNFFTFEKKRRYAFIQMEIIWIERNKKIQNELWGNQKNAITRID